jgi:hypothetical protein
MLRIDDFPSHPRTNESLAAKLTRASGHHKDKQSATAFSGADDKSFKDSLEVFRGATFASECGVVIAACGVIIAAK